MKNILQNLGKHGLLEMTSYFEHPVTDSGLLGNLQRRAGAFELRGQAIPCPLVSELTFDIGSRKINNQMLVSIVDVTKSKELQELISRKLGYQPTPENTGAAMVFERAFSPHTSQKLGKPAGRQEESLTVIHKDKDGLQSVHLITPSSMGAMAVPSVSGRKTEYDMAPFKGMIPGGSELIRGLNDSLVAWNGKQWGLVETAPKVNLAAGNRTIAVGKLGKFHQKEIGQTLYLGMAEPYMMYRDTESGFVIPAPGDAPGQPGRSGFRDWFMQTDPTVYQSVGGGGYAGGGGGGGGGSRVETGATYSGTESCAAEYSTLDACYACCDTQGSQILAAGISITTAVTAAGVTAAAPSVVGAIVGGILIAVIGVTGSLIISWMAADLCKSKCRTFASSGATTGPDSRYVT